MESKTYTILTSKGLETIIDALNTGQKVNITHIAVGDGGGDTPSINEDMTSLVNEVWRGEVDSVVVADDPKQWVKLTAYMPASEGGFEIR